MKVTSVRSLLLVAGVQAVVASNVVEAAASSASRVECNVAMGRLEDASLTCGSAASACNPVCQPLLCGALKSCSPKGSFFGDLSIETTALQMKKMGRLLNNCACQAQAQEPEQTSTVVDQVTAVEVVIVEEDSSNHASVNHSSGAAPPVAEASEQAPVPAAIGEAATIEPEGEAAGNGEAKAEEEEAEVEAAALVEAAPAAAVAAPAAAPAADYGDVVDEMLSAAPRMADWRKNLVALSFLTWTLVATAAMQASRLC